MAQDRLTCRDRALLDEGYRRGNIVKPPGGPGAEDSRLTTERTIPSGTFTFRE